MSSRAVPRLLAGVPLAAEGMALLAVLVALLAVLVVVWISSEPSVVQAPPPKLGPPLGTDLVSSMKACLANSDADCADLTHGGGSMIQFVGMVMTLAIGAIIYFGRRWSGAPSELPPGLVRATGSRRFVGLLIDYLAYAGLVYLITVNWSFESRPPALVFTRLVLAIFVGYAIVASAYSGQTLGKRLARIRVVRLDGTAIGPVRAALRVGVYALPSFLVAIGRWSVVRDFESTIPGVTPFQLDALLSNAGPKPLNWMGSVADGWMMANLLLAIVQAERRSIHDVLAGTVVVQMPKKPAPVLARAETGLA